MVSYNICCRTGGICRCVLSTTGDCPERVYEWGTTPLLAPNEGASGGLGCPEPAASAREDRPLLLIQAPAAVKGSVNAAQFLSCSDLVPAVP